LLVLAENLLASVAASCMLVLSCSSCSAEDEVRSAGAALPQCERRIEGIGVWQLHGSVVV
jgi:hypothetical protein